MGGDHHHHAAEGDFRTKVWSMTGGPNCRPKHWKRNTAIAMFGIFLACIPIAMVSAKLEDWHKYSDLEDPGRSNALIILFVRFLRSFGAKISERRNIDML